MDVTGAELAVALGGTGVLALLGAAWLWWAAVGAVRPVSGFFSGLAFMLAALVPPLLLLPAPTAFAAWSFACLIAGPIVVMSGRMPPGNTALRRFWRRRNKRFVRWR